ncbi:MAG: 4a-hydroxytetrahydrobiopterin dehydratase [Gammaproteobacteria bacterium]
MTELSDKKCVPCEGGVAALTKAEADKLRAKLAADWQLSDDAKSIRRELKFKDFYRAMSFANAVAHIANIEDHHPDLEVGWGYCRIVFSTHAIKGLSENDFICAAKIDRVPLA